MGGITPGQMAVMVGKEGGVNWLLCLCLFDIWPKRTARMKEKKKQSGKGVKDEMGVFISCLGG